MEGEDRRQEVEKFKTTLSPDFYSPEIYINWQSINAKIEQLRSSASSLQVMIDSETCDEDLVWRALVEDPQTWEILRLLLAISGNVEFQDGRRLPLTLPRNEY